MNIWQSFAGKLCVELTSADISQALRNIERAGIVIRCVEIKDALTISFVIERKDIKTLQVLCKQRGDKLKFKQKIGLYWKLKGIGKRPVLLVGMILLFALCVWISGHILFVQVEGNATVPTNLIIEKAMECGIRLGVSSREVRSEIMKNALLEQMPQLKWAGINTRGCVAIISVRERAPEETISVPSFPSSIAAARDGIVRQITVLQGSGVCSVGQTVKAGELLISGYTDCGLCIRVTQAEGEVYAETFRKFSAIFPTQWTIRTKNDTSVKKYSLIIGKKRINFFNSSGILDTGCVKIYSERYVILPMGFKLPIAIVTEEWIPGTYEVVTNAEPESILQPFISQYLQSQMIGGQILSSSQVISYLDGVTRIDGIYSCYEMIGVSVPEERLLEYENH